jgi:hypothetical protein
MAMSGPKLNYKNGSFARLLKVLQIGPNTHDMSLHFPAGEYPEMTVTRILTEEEVEAVADFFESEDLEPVQYGETNYILQARDPDDESKLAQQVEILNNSLNASQDSSFDAQAT